MINRRNMLMSLAAIPFIGFVFQREIHPVILKDINDTFGSLDSFVKYLKNIPRRKVDKCCNANYGLDANKDMIMSFNSFCIAYKSRSKNNLVVTSVYDDNGNKTFRWQGTI